MEIRIQRSSNNKLESSSPCEKMQPSRYSLAIMVFLMGTSTSSVMAYAPNRVNQIRKTTPLFSSVETRSTRASNMSLIDTARMIRMKRLQQEKSDYPSSSSSSASFSSNSPDQQQNQLSGLFGKSFSHPNDKRSNQFSTAAVDLDRNLSFDVDDLFDDDYIIAQKVKEQNISRLQEATGSEVLDIEMHLQMEAARRRAKEDTHNKKQSYATAFIDSHVKDASPSEKFAMAMIPSQLPAPLRSSSSSESPSTTTTTSRITEKLRPVKIVKKKKPRSKKSEKPSTMNNKSSVQQITTAAAQETNSNPLKKSKRNPTLRVTHEEEIKLAQIIQQGAKIHTLKADFESKHQREITRSEWVELAGLDSPKSLRRLVSSYRSAKNKLVTANLGLVHAVVRQVYNKSKGTTQEELIQEGTLGLIRAAELFDPDRGLRFSTYATIWIKGVLGNSKVLQPIALPSREKTKWNKIRKAEADLKALKGDEFSQGIASAEEISRMTDIPPEEIMDLQYKMPRASKMLSLDFQYKGASRSGAEDNSSSGLYGSKALEEDEDLAETMQMKADIVAALARNLEPSEARLMRLRYGLHDGKMRTLVECAECMGLSRQRVQQLAVQCLEKLREANDCKSLQEYLLTVA